MAITHTIQLDRPKAPYRTSEDMDLAMKIFLKKGGLIIPLSDLSNIFYDNKLIYINEAMDPKEYFHNLDLKLDLSKLEEIYGSNTYENYRKSFEKSSYSKNIFDYMKNLLCFNLDNAQELAEILNIRSKVSMPSLSCYLDFAVLDENGLKLVKVGKRSIKKRRWRTKVFKKVFGCTHGKMTINVETEGTKFTFKHTVEKIELEKSSTFLHDQRFDIKRPAWIDPTSNKPSFIEEAVLSYYKEKGYIGSIDHNSESAPFKVLLDCIRSKSLYLDDIDDYIPNHQNDESPNVYDEKSLNKYFSHKEQLLSEKSKVEASSKDRIASISEEEIRRNYKAIHVKSPISIESIIQIFRCMGRNSFSKAIELMGGGETSGFPDLVVCKDNKIEFIEVKGPGDSLNFNQKHFAQNVLEPLGYKLKVAKVIEQGI